MATDLVTKIDDAVGLGTPAPTGYAAFKSLFPNATPAPTLPESLQNLKNPTSAQTAAISTYNAGYKGTTNPKTLSGGASVGQNLSLTKATAQGSAYATGNTGASTGPSKTGSSSTATNSINGASQPVTPTTPITALTAPPPLDGPLSTDPTIGTFQTQANAEISQLDSNYATDQQTQIGLFAPQLQQVQKQMSDAVAAVTAIYGGETGAGNTTLKESVANIQSQFAPQISELTVQQGAALSTLSESYNSNKLNVTQSYETNTMNYINGVKAAAVSALQFTLTNDPPAPLDMSGVTDQASYDTALTQWAANNQGIISQAFDTGQYGDPNNRQNYLSVASMLANPTLGEQKLEVSQEVAGADVERAGAAEESAGAAVSNANTAYQNYALKYQQAGGATNTQSTSAIHNAVAPKETTATKSLGSAPVVIGGTTYTVGQPAFTVSGLTFTPNYDGYFIGSDGNTYSQDEDGNIIPVQ